MEKEIRTKAVSISSLFTPSEYKSLSKYLKDKQIYELLKYFHFDKLACMVWFQKYAYLEGGEVHPDDMHMRMAFEFGNIEDKYIEEELAFKKKYKQETKEHISKYGRDRKPMFTDDIFASMHQFDFIIPQGSVMSQLGTDSIGSLSNCFVVPSPLDSYGGIFYTDQQLGQTMKRRGGVGVDIGTLRPEGASTSNAAKTSTGAVSFMDRFSNTTREVAQGGRRGALMISIGIEHPDIEKFIDIKTDLTKVTGANISIRVNRGFMEAVDGNKDYCLRWPSEIKPVPAKHGVLTVIDGGFVKWVNAKDIWDKLILASHTSAEPGILFWTAVQTHSPDGVYPQFKPISTNPCGEIPIPAYDSCRLIALNLLGFVEDPYTSKAIFNYDKFYAVTYEALRMSDDLVDLELIAVRKIIDKIKRDPESVSIKQTELTLWENVYKTGKAGRRTGLGFTALGDTAAALGLEYGEESFKEVFEDIMRTKFEAELDCTTDMAIFRGSFEGHDSDAEFTEIDGKLYGMNSFFSMIAEEFPEQAEKMYKFGRRNVSWSTVAPTGSLSILALTTSGIEPLFKPWYKRRKKILEQGEDVKADFVDKNGDRWTEHFVIHPQFNRWCELYEYPIENEEELKIAFNDSPWENSIANDIDWQDRIDIQKIAQKYTTHSISSTINLPKETTVNTINNIYTQAYKANLKGVTVYRDGSRDGVLVDSSDIPNANFRYINSIKRSTNVKAIAHTTVVAKERYSVFVGVMNDLPYEVFAYKGGTKEGGGIITKIERGNYQFIGEGDDTRHRIITGKMTDEQEIITRLISGSLRHGRNIRYIVEDLNKTSGSMFSFNSAIARVLKSYIPNGVQSSAKCLECGGNNVVYEEGCLSCKDCGSSKCG